MDSLFSLDKKVSITNAQHPLLLEKYLPKLPNFLDDNDDESDKQKAWDKLAPGSFYDDSVEGEEGDESFSELQRTRFDCQSKVVPINFHIDAEVARLWSKYWRQNSLIKDVGHSRTHGESRIIPTMR